MESDNIAPIYWIWGPDNAAYGPVELPGLVEWVKEGRAKADTWVYLDQNRGWSQASQVPELKLLFPSRSKAAAKGEAKDTPAADGGIGIKPGSLRRIKIFADMEEKHLEAFQQYLEVLSFKQFSEVAHKGDHGDAMFMVLEGELRARLMIDGKESTLTTIDVGESFGEISLLDHGPRSADVVANRDSVLLKLSAATFEKLVREAPELGAPFLFAVSRSVAGRVRVLTKRYEDSIHWSRAAGVID